MANINPNDLLAHITADVNKIFDGHVFDSNILDLRDRMYYETAYPQPPPLYATDRCTNDEEFIRESEYFTKDMTVDTICDFDDTSIAMAVMLIEAAKSVELLTFSNEPDTRATYSVTTQYNSTAYTSTPYSRTPPIRQPVYNAMTYSHDVYLHLFKLPLNYHLINVRVVTVHGSYDLTYLLSPENNATILHYDRGRYEKDRLGTREIHDAITFYEPNTDIGIDEEVLSDLLMHYVSTNMKRLSQHADHYKHLMWLLNYMKHKGRHYK